MNLFQILTPFYPFGGSGIVEQAVHFKVLKSVLGSLKTMNLPGVSASNIVLQKLPWARDWANAVRTFPGIVVCPYGSESMSPSEGVNRRDDVGYPVLISVFQNDNEDLITNLNRYLLWRQKIARFFRNQKLAGVTEIIKTVANPLPVLLPDAFTRGVWHSAISFRFISREVRGDSN